MAVDTPAGRTDYMGVLAMLGVARSTERLIRYYAVHPTARPHLRALCRILHLGMRSVQRDLARLVALGALAAEPTAARICYRVNLQWPLWGVLRTLVVSRVAPAVVIESALSDVDGIEAAFVFGSAASGRMREDSDIDIFVLESRTVDKTSLFRQLAEVGLVLGREVNPVRYTAATLAERLGDRAHPGSAFVREVLSGPMQWVFGTTAALVPLATAAGVSMATTVLAR